MTDNLQDLRQRLAHAESVLESLRNQEVDAVIGKDGVTLLRLRKVEEALRESEERFRSFMDNNPDVAWMKDDQGRYVYLNRRGEERLGIKQTECFGRTDFELWPAEIAKKIRENDLALVAAGKPMEVIEETINQDGTRCYWLSSKFPFRDAAGKFYIGGISVDISASRKAEEDLRQRTVELEVFNRELESYAYSISHDLRTPLRTIHSYSEILAHDYGHVLDQTGKSHLQRICTAVDKMSTLMQAIHKLSRLARSEPIKVEVNLSAIAREIAGELRKAEPDRHIAFDIDEHVTGHADQIMITVALENLLRNAWKFTGKHDKALITFGMKNIGDETIYFVRDDGAGFNMDHAGKIFQAFQRLHRPGEYSGTGIGLATVQHIIHRHGGRIWAEGEVERGAAFYFTLG